MPLLVHLWPSYGAHQWPVLISFDGVIRKMWCLGFFSSFQHTSHNPELSPLDLSFKPVICSPLSPPPPPPLLLQGINTFFLWRWKKPEQSWICRFLQLHEVKPRTYVHILDAHKCTRSSLTTQHGVWCYRLTYKIYKELQPPALQAQPITPAPFNE